MLENSSVKRSQEANLVDHYRANREKNTLLKYFDWEGMIPGGSLVIREPTRDPDRLLGGHPAASPSLVGDRDGRGCGSISRVLRTNRRKSIWHERRRRNCFSLSLKKTPTPKQEINHFDHKLILINSKTWLVHDCYLSKNNNKYEKWRKKMVCVDNYPLFFYYFLFLCFSYI